MRCLLPNLCTSTHDQPVNGLADQSQVHHVRGRQFSQDVVLHDRAELCVGGVADTLKQSVMDHAQPASSCTTVSQRKPGCHATGNSVGCIWVV